MDWLQNFFWALPYFIILIGLLVFVHEGGHFVFAKLFKVKVHVFSLGFGPKLVGFQKGETLYKIALVPVGGYVKMLGEDPQEEISPDERGRAFGDKPIWQRMLIILGGPAMNMIFPLFLYFGVGLTFFEVVPPEVGLTMPGTPADRAGIKPGDIILAVDGRAVESFDHLVEMVAPRPGQSLELKIKRGEQILERTIVPEPTEVPVILDVKETVGRMGIASAYLNALIGVADPDSAAHRAGLRTFDLIVSVNGQPTERLVDLERQLIDAAGTTAEIELKKLRQDIKPPFGDLDELFSDQIHKLMLPVPADIASLEQVGIENSQEFVAYVTPGGVAEEIGLRRGDKLISLDAIPYPMGTIFAAIDERPDVTRVLAWTRNGVRHEKPFLPKFIPAGEAGDLGVKRDIYDKGFWALRQGVLPDLIANPSLLGSAVRFSVSETRAGFKLIWLGFKLLVKGEVSLRSLGGPIMIGQLAGRAAEQGASYFIWIMALISLNLGLINLVPIPVLDGGQMVFLFVEAVTRRPISQVLKERVMLVGVAMILLLMVFATWNDIARLLVG